MGERDKATILKEQREDLKSTFVQTVSAVEGVDRIIDIGDPEADGHHFVFVITDGYHNHGKRVLDVVRSIKKMELGNEQQALLGKSPIFPEIGFAIEYADGIMHGGRPDTVVTELWHNPDLQAA